MATTDGFARELWRRIEAIHAVMYFAEESRVAAEGIGLRGFWRMYFAFRVAPMGECSAPVATAAFFGFSPSMVERAVPGVWELTTPGAAIEARGVAAAGALRRLAPEAIAGLAEDAWTRAVLADAVERAAGGALPLFLSNRALESPADAVTALWQTATTLREHRGDGHVAEWTARGVAPVEVAVLFVAGGGTARDALQPHRGWTDDEWHAAEDRWRSSGHLDAAGSITDAGGALLADVERETDRLADEPFRGLDDHDRERLLAALTPTAAAIGRSEVIPTVNPMGVDLVDG